MCNEHFWSEFSVLFLYTAPRTRPVWKATLKQQVISYKEEEYILGPSSKIQQIYKL
jgi:hypothetical protein